MRGGTARLVEILLVEDEEPDVELVRQALKRSKLANNLHRAANGREALSFLRREPPFEDAPRPDLVLLDLNMPIMNGQDALAEIRQDPALSRLPVVVMTSSDRDEDVARSYDLHANCYVRKPLDLNEFMKIVGNIEEFWLGVVTLPPAT